MKTIWTIALLSLALVSCDSENSESGEQNGNAVASDTLKYDDVKQQTNYSLGYTTASSMKDYSTQVDSASSGIIMQAFLRAMEDNMFERDLEITYPEANSFLQMTEVQMRTGQGGDLDPDKFGYSIGVIQSESFLLFMSGQKSMDKISTPHFLTGVRDLVEGNTPQIPQDEMTALVENFRKQLEEEERLALEANKLKGEKFLDSVRNEPGVQATESGLLYKVIKKGSGASPTPNDKVKASYVLKTIDGEVLQDSKGEPVEFGMQNLIAGWKEALADMKVGEARWLYVPSDLAYGTTPPPGSGILPNSALVFRMELHEIK